MKLLCFVVETTFEVDTDSSQYHILISEHQFIVGKKYCLIVRCQRLTACVVDTSTKSKRKVVMVDTAQPYDVARSDCIQDGGDLMVIVTEQDLNETVKAIKTSDSRFMNAGIYNITELTCSLIMNCVK